MRTSHVSHSHYACLNSRPRDGRGSEAGPGRSLDPAPPELAVYTAIINKQESNPNRMLGGNEGPHPAMGRAACLGAQAAQNP